MCTNASTSLAQSSLISIALQDDSCLNLDMKRYCYDYMNKSAFFINPFPIPKGKENQLLGPGSKLYKDFLTVTAFDQNRPHIGVLKGGNETVWKDYLDTLWQSSKQISSQGVTNRDKQVLYLGLNQGLNNRRASLYNTLKGKFQGK